MIARLEDQKKLVADTNFVRTVKRWERKEGGEKVLVEKPLRTSRWWQPDQSGGYVMTVKVGSKRIEFEKGKAAIAGMLKYAEGLAVEAIDDKVIWAFIALGDSHALASICCSCFICPCRIPPSRVGWQECCAGDRKFSLRTCARAYKS